MFKFINTCTECKKEYEEYSSDQTTNCLLCNTIESRKNDSDIVKNLRASVDDMKNIIVLGPAGSGKSYILKIISEHLQMYGELNSVKPVCFEVITPTGNSAINVGGITYHTIFSFIPKNGIHSTFFNMGVKTIINSTTEYIEKNLSNPRFGSYIKRIKQLRTLIVDEFSMISESILQ